MAKLFNIDTDNKKRNNAIKGMILILGLMAVIASTFIYERAEQQNAEEYSTSVAICVHVKGAVVSSGVYEVPIDTRVKDLEAYVGGFLPEADLDGVNLAEYLKDGSEVYIPYKGSLERGSFDLNSITYDELVNNVEGIGQTYAKKIIEYREKNGGFREVLELKAVLGESVYKKVREKFYVCKE